MASIISAGTSSGTALNMTADTSGQLQLATNSGTTAITIDTSQNVGIGTTTPQGKFNVFGTSIVLSNPNGTTNDSNGVTITTFSSSTPWWSYITNNASHHEWQVYGTEKMRIDTNGNLLVGTTSAVSGTSNTVQISNGSAGLILQNSTNNWRFLNYLGDLYWTNLTTPIDRMKLTSAGQLSTTTGTITSLSDERYKENIVDAPNYLDTLINVRVRKFSLKEENSDVPTNIGVVAQELESILPEMVFDDHGSDGTEYKTVAYTKFIPMLIKSIQEQQAIIEDLKTRITVLESK